MPCDIFVPQNSDSPNKSSDIAQGLVTRVRGSVIDVDFPSGRLPHINNALVIQSQVVWLIAER